MAEPKQHAKYAASSAERWMNCPYSIKLSELAPKRKSGRAADEGTTAHELMEFALEGGVKNVIKFWENDDEKYPLEMREHIQNFVTYVRAQLTPNCEFLVEQKIQLPFLHPTEAFGTVDVAVIEPFGRLHIIDLKYGQKSVNPKGNAQMAYYALGLAHERDFDFEDIATTIYQPRVGSKPRTHVFSVDELKSWQVKFEDAIDRGESATEADICEGSWCFFCPAKMICPAISKKSLVKAQLDFASPVQPDPKSLTSDQLKTILDRATYLELWLNEVKAYAFDQVSSGAKIPGWGLVEKRPTRQWVSQELVLNSEYAFALKQVTIPSPAQSEKILKEFGISKSEINEFFKLSVVSVSSGMKLGQTTNDFVDFGLDDQDHD